jgi:uncharacterized membrane protein YjgN (DUF898 family)
LSFILQTLLAVSIALPFILVRTIYTLLNAVNLDPSGTSHRTTKFNPISGDWAIYLVLGLFMEIAIVAVYIAAGVLMWLRLRKSCDDNTDIDLTD